METKSIAIILFTGVTAIALQFLFRLYTHRRRFNDLPGPPHSFLWGHLKIMGEAAALFPPNTHPQVYITTIAQKYDLKGIFYLDLWPVADAQVILIEPELMDSVQVTRSFDQHRIGDDLMNALVGRNVIATANGAIWKKLHGGMAPAFLMPHVRSLSGLMADETMIFRNTLLNLAKSGKVFSMEAEAAKAIFDIVGRIVFNFPVNAQTEGSSYLNDLKETQELVNQLLSMNPLVKLKVYLRRSFVRKRIDISVTKKILERLALLREEKIVPSRKDPLSILDLMLRDTLLKDDLQTAPKTAQLPPEELKLLVTNVKALLLGGQGTTVDSLCFIYILLSKNPEVMRKLRQEHNSVFGKDISETPTILGDSPNKLNDLEYTTAVIKEALRLFPVGFGVKQAPPGATVTWDGRAYPLDDLAIVPASHTMHYNPKYYPSPSTFQPERFLNDKIPRAWFRTFSRGPRACLGQNLALDILRVILLLTVRDLDFECEGLQPNEKPRSTYTDLDLTYGDTIFQELAMEARPRGPVPMTVRTVT
ncbi:cytochrome P450 [Bisporella sp. PMI_857]|nr:cytochrome P450 [Bisporella sp. PMI_857]